jgi:hypothetical protein
MGRGKRKEPILGLFLAIAITAAVFCILTIPHLSLIIFGMGFAYTQGWLMICSLASIIIGHLICDKINC